MNHGMRTASQSAGHFRCITHDLPGMRLKSFWAECAFLVMMPQLNKPWRVSKGLGLEVWTLFVASALGQTAFLVGY